MPNPTNSSRLSSGSSSSLWRTLLLSRVGIPAGRSSPPFSTRNSSTWTSFRLTRISARSAALSWSRLAARSSGVEVGGAICCIHCRGSMA